MVNLEWYRTFKAIYQSGNLTRAAEVLLISQPNASLQLAALESYIGQKLFVRLPRKLVPTEYGKMLYTQVVGSVENLERVESEFRKAALKRTLDIRIGSPIEYAHHKILGKIGGCNANIYLRFGTANDLVDELEKKELDFVVATQKIEKQNIKYEPLEEENFMAICHSSLDTDEFEQHLSEGDLAKAEQWLLNQKWISYDNKLSVIRRFWKENFNKRPLIKPHYIIPDITMIIDAVGLNHGIAIVSDLFLQKENLPQDFRILWKGQSNTSNQLWLAYNLLQPEGKKVEEMKRILSR